ncbi:unnamed protein product [Effrenium voratum]|nr:unnamed protein product [Effrenium voratum]
MVRQTFEEEEAFQRGHDEEVARPPKPKRPKTQKGKIEKEKEKEKLENSEILEDMHIGRVRRLVTPEIHDGSLLIGTVRDVTEEELTLTLAYHMVAFVQRREASESQKSLLELYEPGQMVVAVVLAVSEFGGRRLRLDASLRPRLVNAGLTAQKLQKNMWLPATVVGEEEHVLSLDLGIDVAGLVKKTEFRGKVASAGSIVMVAVQAVNASVKCSLSSSEPISGPLEPALLKAGLLVAARVKSISDEGLVVNFCGAGGIVHSHYAGPGEWKKNQRLAARVLAVIPGSPTLVHLALLPHILDWVPAKLQHEVGDLLEGEVLDFQRKYGCRVRCEEALGFCAMSRLSDPEKDVAASTVQLGFRTSYRVLSHNFLDGVLMLTRRPMDLTEGVLVSVAQLAPGQLVTGTVSRTADHGIQVKLSDYVSGHVHLRQLTDVPLASVPKRFQVGSKVKCRVLHVHKAKRQLTLTTKKSLVQSDFQLTANSSAKVNMLVTGYVSSIKDFGAIVSFYGGARGLLRRKEMEAEEAPALGMAVVCRVVHVDRKLDRITLSLDLEKGKSAAELAASAQEPVPKVAKAPAESGQASETVCRTVARKERRAKTIRRIKRPEEQLQPGSLVTLRVRSIAGLQLLCSAPVHVRGHVHATQLVDIGDMANHGAMPLQRLRSARILEARVLRTKQRDSETGKGDKICHVELTCRPSLMDPKDASEYEKALVRWPLLLPGTRLVAAVVSVQKSCIWMEVAPGIRGRVALLDLSPDLSVLRAVAEHFKVGQVFQAHVLRAVSSRKELDLSLLDFEAQKTCVGKLRKVHEGEAAAVFELPGRRWGSVHITELFDVWAKRPTQRLHVGSLHELAILNDKEKLEVSLRQSQVHGHKEVQEEKRPKSAEELKVGQKVSGYVVSAVPQGVFVALSRSLTARIKLKALSDMPVMKEAVAKMHPPGSLLRDITVVQISEGRVELSLRTGDGPGGLTCEQLSVGDVVSGKVKAVEPYGLFVRLDNSNVDAFIHKSEIADSASITVNSYAVGAKIHQAKVLKVDGSRVGLTIKPSNFSGEELEEDADSDEMPEMQELLAELQKTRKKGKKRKAEAGTAAKEAKTKEREQEGDAEVSEEEPWQPVQKSAGASFEFAEFKVDSASSSDAADEEDDEQTLQLSKRQKKAKRKEEDKELQKQEAENADGRWADDPQSVEDFERLLLTQGDTSIVWIRYMAFHLKMSDLEKARQVAERAVKHVGFADSKERFNVWVAYMNLECTFGSDETSDAIFRRAASHNEAKQVYMQLARIHERNKKPSLAVKAYEACTRKFPQSKKVWMSFLGFLYQTGDAEGARKVLPKSLAALPRQKHPVVVSKAAILEYQHGSPDRGRSIFEGLLDSYPKRTDLWSVYFDAHIKAHTPPKVPDPDCKQIRPLFLRCCAMPLKATKMRFFFKRWLDFEMKWGDAQSQEQVRAKARDFVESL